MTVAMSGDAHAGVAVTSHNNSTLAGAVIEKLEVRRHE